MKSQLVRIGIVSLMVGLMAFASSAYAQSTPEVSDRTIAPETAAPPPIVAAADTQMPYGPEARPASNQPVVSPRQLAADTPAAWLERETQRGSTTNPGGRGPSETPPCLGAGHYYDASVVNSVPSSCFAGNSGPAPLGGLF